MKKILVFLTLILCCSSITTDSINVGDKAPDIVLLSPKGKEIKLSSLKGKMVLLDFWASWCGPCRQENPNVVEAYQKYKDRKFKEGKGFEIYSVSLDRTNDPWIQAIEKDKLTWKSHVWDKEGLASTKYEVRFIPTAFLIDGKGKIIAKGENIRGLRLHTTLDGLLKK